MVKPFFLRADLNVTLVHGKLINDFRLQALRPTLDLLITKHARIVLGTHLGRPEGFKNELSTHILLPWFQEHGYRVKWAPDLVLAQTSSKNLPEKNILLLENLRFSQHEHEPTPTFAHELYSLAEFYVNDAFALLHRHDTSITLLPSLYPKSHKTIGLLVEKELKELDKLMKPEKPFTIILGGGKVKDKLPFIEAMLEKVNCIIILPALAFTFLKALGHEVGKSLIDESYLPQVKNVLRKAEQKNVKIILPVDFLVAEKSVDGPLKVVQKIESQDMGISIGPESLNIIETEIKNARSIFLNGAMGLFERPETLEPFKKLLQTIAQSTAFTVIGGGGIGCSSLSL